MTSIFIWKVLTMDYRSIWLGKLLHVIGLERSSKHVFEPVSVRLVLSILPLIFDSRDVVYITILPEVLKNWSYK